MREIILDPFRKQNTFKNLRIDRKFGTDLVNSDLANTIWAPDVEDLPWLFYKEEEGHQRDGFRQLFTLQVP